MYTGLSAGNAAKLVSSFGIIGGLQGDMLTNQVDSIRMLSQAMGVDTLSVMEDIADSATEFAMFTRNSGKNIAHAAIAARSLGVEFSKVVSAAESLLDFETSIGKQFEAQALLNKNLDFSRIRVAAAEGDLVGVLKEQVAVLNSVGDLTSMNMFERRALAGALGIEVEAMFSLVKNQENLNKLSKEQIQLINTTGASTEEVFQMMSSTGVSFANKFTSLMVGEGGSVVSAIADTRIALSGLGGVFGMLPGKLGKFGGMFGKLSTTMITAGPAAGSAATGLSALGATGVAAAPGLMVLAKGVGVLSIGLIGMGAAVTLAGYGFKLMFNSITGTIDATNAFVNSPGVKELPETTDNFFSLAESITAVAKAINTIELSKLRELNKTMAPSVTSAAGNVEPVHITVNLGTKTLYDEMVKQNRNRNVKVTVGNV